MTRSAPIPADAVPVDEWPIEIDEPVELLVEHFNYRFASASDRAQWLGWFDGYWTDFNGGGWVWEGMCGEVRAIRPKAPA